jgi:hypothetical protein
LPPPGFFDRRQGRIRSNAERFLAELIRVVQLLLALACVLSDLRDASWTLGLSKRPMPPPHSRSFAELLVEVNGHAITTPDDLLRIYGELRDVDHIRIEIVRGARSMILRYRIIR